MDSNKLNLNTNKFSTHGPKLASGESYINTPIKPKYTSIEAKYIFKTTHQAFKYAFLHSGNHLRLIF